MAAFRRGDLRSDRLVLHLLHGADIDCADIQTDIGGDPRRDNHQLQHGMFNLRWHLHPEDNQEEFELLFGRLDPTGRTHSQFCCHTFDIQAGEGRVELDGKQCVELKTKRQTRPGYRQRQQLNHDV